MEAVQLTLFGKMFPEHLAATGVTISGESCKKSQRPQFQCLNLEDGHQAEWLELNKLESLGELSTPSIGAYPSKESESTLSEILETDVPKKYYLSPKACQGILRRAQKRGKILPPLLKAALEAQAEANRPKIIFADAVAASHNSILIGDLAKLIKQNGVDIGQKRLFEWLRNNGYLMKSGASYNLPTQKSMELKLFEIKERTINNPDGSIRTTKTTKVTGKGQQYFINKLLSTAMLKS